MDTKENITGDEPNVDPESEEVAASEPGDPDFSGAQKVMIKAVTKDVLDRNPGVPKPKLVELSLMEILGAAAALLKTRNGKGN